MVSRLIGVFIAVLSSSFGLWFIRLRIQWGVKLEIKLQEHLNHCPGLLLAGTLVDVLAVF